MIGVSNITNRTDPGSLRSRVFVGNLNTLHIQKPEIEAIFSKYGTIIGISVHKGYAFIQYANELHARNAACSEDSNTYYGMKLDITIASEPRNRKRVRSTAGNQQVFDLTLQSQALAAMGGQFSQLGFMNNNLALSTQPQFGAFGPNTPLIGAQPAKLPSGVKGNRSNPLITSSSSSSSAKRTRLETSAIAKNGPGLLSGARTANLVPLITPKTGIDAKTSPLRKAVDEGKPPVAKGNAISEVLGVEDILICGQCRRLFDSVDVLIAHKMAGCPHRDYCRCKMAGEPASMDCNYCGENFISAWELVAHCDTEHGLTIYSLPSSSTNGSVADIPSPSEKPTAPTIEERQGEEYLDDPVTPRAEIPEKEEDAEAEEKEEVEEEKAEPMKVEHREADEGVNGEKAESDDEKSKSDEQESAEKEKSDVRNGIVCVDTEN